MKRCNVFLLQLNVFGIFWNVVKEIGCRGNFTDNPSQNIFRIVQVLAKFPFTTSETKLD